MVVVDSVSMVVGGPWRSRSAAILSLAAEAERANGRNPDCEIVLVGADSLETLQTTHAHYFGDRMESTSPHLAGV
jgi:hypothetical protein